MRRMIILYIFLALVSFSLILANPGIAQDKKTAGTEPPSPVYAITFGDGLIYTSVDANTWTLRNSGIKVPLTSLTFGNNMFVAVGAKGTILNGSKDGLNWKPVKSGIPDDLWAITFANNMFVAVGANGTVIISADGLNWTKTAVLTPGKNLKNIVYGYRNDDYFRKAGYFMTISDNGTIFKSYDGATWESEHMKYASNLSCVIYVNELFIAVGKYGSVMTSPIGFGEWLTWLDRYSQTMENLHSITYGGGKYVTVGANGTIMISDDLSRWRVVNSGTKSDLCAAAYGRGKFIVVGLDGTILTSSDGENWAPAIKK
jgi:photosystem II stability/assembly factor-like uncharacterized protein